MSRSFSAPPSCTEWMISTSLPGLPLSEKSQVVALLEHNVTIGIGTDLAEHARNTRFDVAWVCPFLHLRSSICTNAKTWRLEGCNRVRRVDLQRASHRARVDQRRETPWNREECRGVGARGDTRRRYRELREGRWCCVAPARDGRLPVRSQVEVLIWLRLGVMRETVAGTKSEFQSYRITRQWTSG